MKKKQILVMAFILNLFVVNAQNLNVPDSEYIRREIKSIDVDTNYINGNWNPILDQVKNKRIVLLGELNHGSKEVFLTRNDLIKSLHEKLGFNVILFESGLGELASIEFLKDTLTPTQMTYGFFDGWRTKEFVDLMEYIKSRNISVSGFDVQRTGSSFQNLLKTKQPTFNQIINLEFRFSQEKRKLTNRKAVYDSVKKSSLKLISDYKFQLSLIDQSKKKYTDDSFQFVKRTILNRIEYLEYFLDFVKDTDWNKRWAARDYMMYSNIDWLLKTVYNNQKVIIIAHNFHISRYNENEEVMGEFLNRKYDSEMYSMGVFAGRGSYFNNRGLKENLTPASSISLDIKHIINSLNQRVSFLDIPININKETAWLNNEIIINDTFIDLSNSNRIILSKNFDGLLFIDKISVPEK